MPARRSVIVAVLTVTAAALAPAAPVAAAPDALRSYVLPGARVFPEGIDVIGGRFYVTSTRDGSILRGDLRQRRAERFIAAEKGQFGAVGIRATADRLLVAGGPSGTVTVYDRSSGERVAGFSNGGGAGTFVNDVAVAPNGDAYITDSSRPVVYRIPAAALRQHRAGVQDLPVFRDLRGTAFTYVAGAFNANGIVVTADGQSLLVVNSETGRLYRIRVGSGAVSRVQVTGGALTGGDGLVLLDSNVLYVVRNSVNRILEVRLSPDHAHGRVVSATSSPSFDFPTTAAVAGDRLLVVNSQFGALLTGQDPALPFTVSSIRLP